MAVAMRSGEGELDLSATAVPVRPEASRGLLWRWSDHETELVLVSRTQSEKQANPGGFCGWVQKRPGEGEACEPTLS